ncbi:hypothetical protein C3489_05035 [Streptomyces sp. Ru71]|uniref:hypothetical protein n=1 Tax=Streptomyces sp. Ru71 TaxID=2080746 RepID=UPI000CDD6E95|nr:hypothetical protein [Streptomyces sp. Ru71]POX56419.1 hypothetical protein C3489_05035 [Streptomyces sp. Ru71]
MVDFQASDGTPILRVPLADWLPETGLVGLLHLSPEDCLERTGLRALAAGLGISWGGTEQPTSDAGSEGHPKRATLHDVPAWHSWLRGLGTFVWFVFFLLLPMSGNGGTWTFLIAAVGLFLLPGTEVAARLVHWSRTRGDAPFEKATVVRPSPEPGGGASRRFVETAAVRILPTDVVLTNAVGEERWLARNTGHGVVRLVRLLDGSSGAFLGVELRDGANAARALLPWKWWFAGPSGPERWARLVDALGVPAVDEKVRPSQDLSRWWERHALAADAMRMSPIAAKEARRRTSRHLSVVGGAEVLVVTLYSLIPLAGLASSHGAAFAVGALAALTVLGELGPVIGHQLNSRMKLDRPIAPGLR